MPAYYTICTRDGYRWAPQFGDPDRDTVEDEVEDNYSDYHPACIRIICTDYDQSAIVAAVAKLNANDPEVIAADQAAQAHDAQEEDTMTTETNTARPSSITVLGRRWFQKTYGNTYHSVTVTNDDTGEQLREPFEYGYGDQWEETAAHLIEAAGWLPTRERSPNGSRAPLRLWLEREGVQLHRNLEDVKRQKDL